MWELDCEESWALKNWCFWGVVLEKTLESPLDCKEIQPGHPKGNQSWIFIRRTDAEAETPILGHLMWSTYSSEKTLTLGKIEGGRRKGQQRMRWLDGIPTQWSWVWVNSGSWWWTRRPGVLQSVASQRVRLNWATELIVWATVHTNPHTHTHDSFRWRGKGLSHTVFSNHICQMPSISRQSSLLTLLPLWWCATTESHSWSLILSSHSGNSLMSLTSVITSILLTPKSKS